MMDAVRFVFIAAGGNVSKCVYKYSIGVQFYI